MPFLSPVVSYALMVVVAALTLVGMLVVMLILYREEEPKTRSEGSAVPLGWPVPGKTARVSPSDRPGAGGA